MSFSSQNLSRPKTPLSLLNLSLTVSSFCCVVLSEMSSFLNNLSVFSLSRVKEYSNSSLIPRRFSTFEP